MGEAGQPSDGASGAGAGAGIDEDEAALLRQSGRAWAKYPAANPIDPDLGPSMGHGAKPGDRYLRGARQRRDGFEKVSPGILKATLRADQATGRLGRTTGRIRHALLGNPRATSEALHERLTKLKALA